MSKSKQLDVVFLSLSMNDLNEGMNIDDTMFHVDKVRSFYEFPPIIWPSQMNQLNQHVNRRTDMTNFGGSFRHTRNSSAKINGLKTVGESISSRYKHVSIFNWYTPKNFKQQTRKPQGGHVMK